MRNVNLTALTSFSQQYQGVSRIFCATECSKLENCGNWAYKKDSRSCYLQTDSNDGQVLVDSVQVYESPVKITGETN